MSKGCYIKKEAFILWFKTNLIFFSPIIKPHSPSLTHSSFQACLYPSSDKMHFWTFYDSEGSLRNIYDDLKIRNLCVKIRINHALLSDNIKRHLVDKMLNRDVFCLKQGTCNSVWVRSLLCRWNSRFSLSDPVTFLPEGVS